MKEYRLTSLEVSELERLFAAEIEGRPIVQRDNRTVRRMIERGLVERVTKLMGFNDGFPSMAITGVVLTLAGHEKFCEWCAENVVDEEGEG